MHLTYDYQPQALRKSFRNPLISPWELIYVNSLFWNSISNQGRNLRNKNGIVYIIHAQFPFKYYSTTDEGVAVVNRFSNGTEFTIYGTEFQLC